MEFQCVNQAITLTQLYNSRIDTFINGLGIAMGAFGTISTLFFIILGLLVFNYVKEREEVRRSIAKIKEAEKDAFERRQKIIQFEKDANSTITDFNKALKNVPKSKKKDTLQKQISQLQEQVSSLKRQTQYTPISLSNDNSLMVGSVYPNLNNITFGTVEPQGYVGGATIQDINKTLQDIKGTVSSNILSEYIGTGNKK